MRRWRGVLVCGLILAAILIALAVPAFSEIKHRRETPAAPELVVLGAKQDVTWTAVPLSQLRQSPWGVWKPDRLAAGESRIPVTQWDNGKRSEIVVPGPDGKARDFGQDLFCLSVPDRMGRYGHINDWTVRASGRISRDSEQYLIDFLQSGGVSNEHWLVFQTNFDQSSRILSVQIGWAFPKQDGQACSLRYRLTPEGFTYLNTAE